MSAAFEKYFLEMAQNPPDPNEPLPWSNRPSTMYGTTISFHVLSWAAVLFRLHVKFRLVKEPGWDDYIIALCTVFNLVGISAMMGAIPNGLGHHILYLENGKFVKLMQLLYINLAAYNTCTGLVKLSLICQYLRLFKKGIFRQICIVLLVVVTLWSIFWFIQGWFPCFPPSGFWDRAKQPPPLCWGSGFATMKGAVTAMYAFAASNMALDTIIFAIPMVVYLKPGLVQREVVLLLALFSLGAVVVGMAIIRLWTMAKRNVNDVNSMDFTWWYPLTTVISHVEINLAIICASIPICWPVIVKSLPQIFVTQEVHVTHEQMDDFELQRPNSIKSQSSQQGLTTPVGPESIYYSNPLIADHVCGKVPTTVEVVGSKRKKRFR